MATNNKATQKEIISLFKKLPPSHKRIITEIMRHMTTDVGSMAESLDTILLEKEKEDGI